MAIEKVVNIVVKETGVDELNKKVNKLEASVESLEDAQEGLGKSLKGSSNAVLENGGAMGLLNDATGGLAMTVKDAVEASVLFTKSQRAAAIAQGFYSTVVGTSTGAMKLFRIALVSTGIGAIVVGLGLLIANFDKVKKAVFALIPVLAKVGEFVEGIVQAITDFVGVTSDATRELDRLGEEANKTLEKNKFFLDAYGDKYDEYTKRKIDANNKYAQHVKDISEDETLTEEQKLRRLKILRERANREILDAENDRNEALAKKRKEAQDKIDEENNKRLEKEKADREKASEEARKKAEEAKKKAEEDALALNDFIVKVNNAQTEDKENTRIAQQEILDKGVQDFLDAEQRKEDEDKRTADNALFIEESLNNSKVNLANQTFDILSQLAKEGSALSKGIAVAQATMNTYQGITAALSAVSVIPDPIGSALKFANAGLIGVQGFLNVKKILATKSVETSSPGGGGSIGSGGGISAPSFNLVQGTNANQIASSISEQRPTETFVVASNVTTQAGLDRNIVKEASLG